MSARPDDPDIILTLSLREGGRTELWTRDGMPGSQLAELLESMAQQFRTGQVTRVQ